jgi:predicted aminopeptidase
MNEILNSMRLTALVLLCSTQLVACSFGYYWQATSGHWSIMRQRRPVAEVIADPETTQTERAKLEIASAAVEFAHQVLLLPDNGSYQLYADTGRRYVVWNVVAAPEFSLQPLSWCFPVAGCVSYRGYFSEDRAQDFAASLAANGADIHVGGVVAYSTLGRFADPLLNTMMVFSDDQLAGLVFHELAHQRVYARDDSKFNEGFASFVEEEGIYRWLLLLLQRRRQTLELFIRTREQLVALYEQDVADELKRTVKQALLDALNLAYDRGLIRRILIIGLTVRLTMRALPRWQRMTIMCRFSPACCAAKRVISMLSTCGSRRWRRCRAISEIAKCRLYCRVKPALLPTGVSTTPVQRGLRTELANTRVKVQIEGARLDAEFL